MTRCWTGFLAVAAAAAGLSGCAGLPGPAEPPVLTVRGELTYRARVALPPDAVAVVELREVSAGEGRVVAEQRIELKGRQVPVPFDLAVDRSRLAAGQRYSVRGGFVVGGRPAWVSEPAAIDPAAKAIDLGALVLAPFKLLGFASDMVCGEQRITVGFVDDRMRIRAGAETIDLRPAPAASGAKFEAVGDPSTTFWSKGDRATFTLRGRTLPECVAAARQGRPLQGAEWRVEDFAGRGSVEGQRVTREFGAGGARIARCGDGRSITARRTSGTLPR